MSALADLRRRSCLGSLAAVAAIALGGCGGGGGAPGPQAGSSPAQSTTGAGGRSARSGQTPAPIASSTAQDAAVSRLARLGLPIYCAGRRGNLVALTFDDGPGPYTAKAIRKLEKHGERATFFLVGKSLKAFGSALVPAERRIGAVGDHTLTHPLLTTLPAGGAAAEIGGAQSLVARAAGTAVNLFRPPYGGRNPAIDAQASKLGMAEILWDVDSADSLGANYAGIAANVARESQPGSIILMHENRGQTIRALLTILPALARRHLKTVSVPELLAADPPSEAQLRAGPHGCGAGAGRSGPAAG